jgi:hypothetical protein
MAMHLLATLRLVFSDAPQSLHHPLQKRAVVERISKSTLEAGGSCLASWPVSDHAPHRPGNGTMTVRESGQGQQCVETAIFQCQEPARFQENWEWLTLSDGPSPTRA